MNSILQTTALTKRFYSARSLLRPSSGMLALDHLDLTVPESSIYALVGPNGAGKTTTIKILMNLLRATSGESMVFGHGSGKLAPADFARIGYVSENQVLPGWMSVGYLMEYLRPFYPTWDREREKQLLRQLELPLDRKLRHLSRGMLMKAALAAALAHRPRLIVMDEPFSGLDALVRDELIESLLESVDGATVFISSHDLSDIESFSSHVGFLYGGRLRSSEELATLSARFREIEVTAPAAGATDLTLPTPWPRQWLNPDRSGAVTRFTDSQFDAGSTPALVQSLFGATCRIDVSPMSLRSIFVATTKARREEAK
jgi:ABC-2 type transport system ATP-binding protein